MAENLALGAIDHNDVDMILQALDALERQHGSDRIIGSMLTAILARTKEEREQIQKESDSKVRAAEADQRRLRESVSLLRAKVILLRREMDSTDADRLLRQSRE